jgi:hypothetical protein
MNAKQKSGGITIEYAARILGLRDSEVRALIRHREIKARRLSANSSGSFRTLVDIDSLLDFEARRRCTANSANSNIAKQARLAGVKA